MEYPPTRALPGEGAGDKHAFRGPEGAGGKEVAAAMQDEADSNPVAAKEEGGEPQDGPKQGVVEVAWSEDQATWTRGM